MPVLAAPALMAAALLALAGAQKLLDPITTVGALRALGWPSSSSLVRVGAVAELALGVSALVIGGPLLWALAALSYGAFAVFVVSALRHGTMIGSCGCFGREDTPPHPIHVLLDLVLGGVAAGAALSLSGSLLETLVDHGTAGLAVAGLAIAGVCLLYAAFVALPRALAAGRTARGQSH